MIIDNNILESDIIKSFMNNYDFPKDLKIKLIITTDIETEYKNQLQ